MKKYYNDFINILKRKVYLFICIIKYKMFLKNGCYKINYSHSQILKTEITPVLKSDILSRSSSHLKIKHRVLFDKITPPYFTYIYSKNKIFLADTFYFTAFSKTKFINHSDMKILTLYNNKEMYNLLANNYSKLENFLPLIGMKFENLTTVEPIINGSVFSHNSNEDKISYFSVLAKSYKDYFVKSKPVFNDQEKVNIIITDALSLPIENNIREIILHNKEEIRYYLKSLPLLYSHNDLHGRNILTYKKNVVLIDLEQVKCNYVFYDLCFLILSEIKDGYSEFIKILDSFNIAEFCFIDKDRTEILWLTFMTLRLHIIKHTYKSKEWETVIENNIIPIIKILQYLDSKM